MVSPALQVRVLVVMAALVLHSATARADWLRQLDPCAVAGRERQPGRAEVLYPSVSRPALVAAGQPLVVRVHVPAALTPPPGHQQEPALHGWSAELTADNSVLIGNAEHRYGLRVADIRPDGASTLIYQATMPVPRWAAPGTYTLRFTSPWAPARTIVGAVQIMDPEQPPRIALARLPEDERGDADFVARLRALSIDAFLVQGETDRLRRAFGGARGRGVATLWLDGSAIHVAYGATTIEVACDGSRRVDDATRAVLAPPPPGHVRLGNTIFAPPEPARLDAAFGEVNVTTELTVVVEENGQTLSLGQPARFFPATPIVAAGYVPSIAAVVTLRGGETATLVRRDTEKLEVTLSTEEVEAGDPASFHARANRPLATVGWQLHEDVTAIGSDPHHVYASIDPMVVYALAIAEDGSTTRAGVEVLIKTRADFGCAVTWSATKLPPSGIVWTIFAGSLIFRRRTCRAV